MIYNFYEPIVKWNTKNNESKLMGNFCSRPIPRNPRNWIFISWQNKWCKTTQVDQKLHFLTRSKWYRFPSCKEHCTFYHIIIGKMNTNFSKVRRFANDMMWIQAIKSLLNNVDVKHGVVNNMCSNTNIEHQACNML